MEIKIGEKCGEPVYIEGARTSEGKNKQRNQLQIEREGNFNERLKAIDCGSFAFTSDAIEWNQLKGKP